MSVLANTRLRKRLLAYSFSHEGEAYHVRELASLIEEDPGNLSRELNKYETEGLYKSMTRGKMRIYSLNRSYPLYKEVKKIIFKTEGIEGSLKKLVNNYDEIAIAFIYGSFASGKNNTKSDIDVVLVGNYSKEEVIAEIRRLENKLHREIHTTSYNEEEFERERIKTGGFLNIVLKNRTILLKGKIDD